MAHDDAAADATVFGRALLAASAADPPSLIDELRAELLRLPGALDLTMHLIDYRLLSLRPVAVDGGTRLERAQPVEDSAVGAAFRTDQPTSELAPAGHLWHQPITVHGQRLGVLTGTFADSPAASAQAVLRALALAAAHGILEMSPGTDLYETSRRHGHLSVAAEMQWQLLPAGAFRTRHFYIAGHLEPALRVAGDAYDFAINDRTLTLAVVDVAGTSGAPSGLTTLVVSALRNARRSRLPLSEQASLASDVVWQHSGGRAHASAILAQVDARTGRAFIVDAGSPAVIRARAGELAVQRFEPQTPLGMFEGTPYTEQPVDLEPGDRAYLLSDGAFGSGRDLDDVVDLLRSEGHGADQPPPESIRRLVSTLTRGGEEPEDDITMLCFDWHATANPASPAPAPASG